MFSYSPTPDRSGEIMAAGTIGAAQSNAQMMGQLGQDIGGALTTLAAAYGQRQGTIAKGKNFKKFMGMAGSAFGIDDTKLGMFNDMEDFDAGLMLENFGSWMPAMANAQLGRTRAEVTANTPIIRNEITNANTRAEEGDAFDGTMLPSFNE